MANSAKDLQLIELKDTISELNKLVGTLQQTIVSLNAREAELKQERDNLKDQVALLTKKLFGSSSERRVHSRECSGQLSMFDGTENLDIFNEAEAEQDPPAALLEETEKTTPRPRKKKTVQAERFSGIPVKKIRLDLPRDQKNCPECGSPLKEIGEEFVRRELQFIPAKLKVIEYYSVNYSCPVCEEEEKPHNYKGKSFYPHHLHGMGSASAIAWTMYQKYCNCVPLYRQEKDWAQYGADLSRGTLANWIILNSRECFAPMMAFLKRRLLKRKFLMADETTTQVLKEPNRRAQTRSFMWVYRTGEDGDVPIILYKYSETRAGENARDYLDGYSGYLMCDGYSGYNKVKTAKRCSCWAHVRRYLVEAVPKGKENDLTQPAVQGLAYVNRLFRLEKEIHEKHQDPDAIKQARLKKEKPVLDGFWTWLDKQTFVRGSRFEKAIVYIRNRKLYLETYLEDGRCSFSNNASERSVKPYVMGRKNWLFADTPDGAVASEMVYSIIETAKANGVNVYHYLTYLLEHCPSPHTTDEELERLAPWNEDVKAELEKMFQDEDKTGSVS